MYKVMLVDHEPNAIQEVYDKVPWDKHDCEIVAVASNGLDASELAHKETPDIMFVSIYLPRMDGLSLVAALRNEFPKLQITILSEYSDFSYAQRGIELGVSRYLIKPVRIPELISALKAMISQLEFYSQITFPPTSDELVADNRIVQNALDYMEENYNEHLTLPVVADQIFVSQWHLSKLISRTRGESFNDILNGIRISRAKELLEHTNLQIQEISSRVGFNDVTHFARVFKKQTGLSANQYRNNILEKKERY